MAKVLSLQDSLCCNIHWRNRWRHRENFVLRTTSYRCTYNSQIFFGSYVMQFSRDPSRSRTGSYIPFSTRKPQAKVVPRKDFFMPLRTLKNARKGCWVISPDYCVSHPWHFCAIRDDSCSKIWGPLGLTLRCMPYGRGMLRNPLWRIL